MSNRSYISETFDFNGDCLNILRLFANERHPFFLDSSQYDPHRGRFSFIGFDPFETFIHRGKDTLDQLRTNFDQHVGDEQNEFFSSLTPLTSGLVGCLSYDYGLSQEKITPNPNSDFNCPDCFFGFYDCIITVDHFTQKIILTSSGLPETEPQLRRQRAQQRLLYMKNKLKHYLAVCDDLVDVDGAIGKFAPEIKSNFSKDQYITAVQKALDHIDCGNIYQVNVSQQFQVALDGHKFDPLLLYRDLSTISPAPFGGYIHCGDFQLISNSPERFLRLNGGIVQSRPMKGTRPRGMNESQDQQYREELSNSPKERAELMMITDLMRNDLGRVCDYGSVAVSQMRTIEEYKYVFQATSTIEGKIRADKDCFDLMKACFPGGSITGCPKIRAMEVIEELEPVHRGMYTGSMGYINFAGNMDFNVLIRTIVYAKNQLTFQVGGGIVADSVPEKEYQETLVKARAICDCLKRSLSVQESIQEHKVNI